MLDQADETCVRLYTQKKRSCFRRKSIGSVFAFFCLFSLLGIYIGFYENIQRQICSVLPNCHRKPIVNVELVGCPRLCCCLCCVDQILLFLQLSMSFFWGGWQRTQPSEPKKKKKRLDARSLADLRSLCVDWRRWWVMSFLLPLFCFL